MEENQEEEDERRKNLLFSGKLILFLGADDETWQLHVWKS